MKQRYKRGFVLGKFMPLHVGHMYLLDTAQASCEQLTILLCSQPDDPIPGSIRLSWLKEAYPHANVVHHPDPLPRDQSRSEFWDIWRDSIRKYCPDAFDAVFSSESYGERLANEIGSIHVSVDPERKKYPISGTEIRQNPKENWEFIPNHVKTYYTEK